MENLAWLCVAILVAYGCALTAALVRYRFRGRVGAVLAWSMVPFVMACPLFVPSAELGLRAASAFVSGDIIFKMVDYFRRWSSLERRVVLCEYYRFLIPFPILSAVYPDHQRRLLRPESPWPQVLRLFAGIFGFTVAVLALMALSGLPAVRSSFALNHAVMLLTFVVAIESLSLAICGLERLAGFDTKPPIQNAYLSRTVSEFWRRYNYRIHDWHYRNIFQPAGGRHSPVRSLLLVFVFSGLFHELMFAVATSRLTGYQFAFFAIQGPAALASRPLDRLAKRSGIVGKITAHGATIVFMAVTSVLFFDGVSKIFPFIYASPSPLP